MTTTRLARRLALDLLKDISDRCLIHRHLLNVALDNIEQSGNVVGAGRIMRRFAPLAGPSTRVKMGRNHACLTARPLYPYNTTIGQSPKVEQGLAVYRLCVLMGKKGLAHDSCIGSFFFLHALARLYERAGLSRADGRAVLAAVAEASEAVDAAVLAHFRQPLRQRLNDRDAPALLVPGGPGAFLGYLRPITDERGRITVLAELHTWVNEERLDGSQATALAMLRSPPCASLDEGISLARHVALAYEMVQGPYSGDRIARDLHYFDGVQYPGLQDDQIDLVASRIDKICIGVRLNAISPDQAARLLLSREAQALSHQILGSDAVSATNPIKIPIIPGIGPQTSFLKA